MDSVQESWIVFVDSLQELCIMNHGLLHDYLDGAVG